jgi:tripartite-type tricarboxylate transporter receptor subunit TctC
VQFGVYALGSVLQLVNAGKIIPLAVGSGKRATALPNLPNLPTIAESGVPGFDVTMWYGLFAPAKTPEGVIRKINDDMQRALKDPDVARLLVSQGADPAPTSTEEFARRIESDRSKWDAIVKQRNLMIEQ